MVQLIVGDKGKGKTIELLARVNEEIKAVSGNIVYLDKSTKHMYELNNKVRLINVNDFNIQNCNQFIGFICGIISQDNDLESMYFDSFLDIACLDPDNIEETITSLTKISESFKVNFTVSASVKESNLSESLKKLVIVTL